MLKPQVEEATTDLNTTAIEDIVNEIIELTHQHQNRTKETEGEIAKHINSSLRPYTREIPQALYEAKVDGADITDLLKLLDTLLANHQLKDFDWGYQTIAHTFASAAHTATRELIITEEVDTLEKLKPLFETRKDIEVVRTMRDECNNHPLAQYIALQLYQRINELLKENDTLKAQINL